MNLDDLYRRDRARCWICGKPVSKRQASRDHVLPKSRGGSNKPENLRLAHRKCNGDRGNTPAEMVRGPLFPDDPSKAEEEFLRDLGNCM